MNLNRRALIAGALSAPLVVKSVNAQSRSDKPIRLVVPYAPGGTADAVGRMLAEIIAPILGQSVVIDNRSGGGGMIGANAVAKSDPDGLTLLLGLNGPISINPAIRSSMQYDPLKDFRPVTLICEIPGLLAVPASLPARSLSEFVALEREKPGSMSFASQGIGTTGHLAGELLNVLAGVKMAHVPYRGTSQAMGDLLSGRVQSTWDLPTVLIPQKDSGQLRIIAAASQKRLPELPEVATVVEQGFPALVYATWVGMLAPANTPAEIVDRLNDANQRALADPEVQKKLAVFAAPASGLAKDDFHSYLAAEITKWRGVAKQANISID